MTDGFRYLPMHSDDTIIKVVVLVKSATRRLSCDRRRVEHRAMRARNEDNHRDEARARSKKKKKTEEEEHEKEEETRRRRTRNTRNEKKEKG